MNQEQLTLVRKTIAALKRDIRAGAYGAVAGLSDELERFASQSATPSPQANTIALATTLDEARRFARIAKAAQTGFLAGKTDLSTAKKLALGSDVYSANGRIESNIFKHSIHNVKI